MVMVFVFNYSTCFYLILQYLVSVLLLSYEENPQNLPWKNTEKNRHAKCRKNV